MKTYLISILLFFCALNVCASTPQTSPQCSTDLTEALTQVSTTKSSYNCTESTATLKLDNSEQSHSIRFSINDLPIAHNKPFYGLAAYYNNIYFFLTSAEGVQIIRPDKNIVLSDSNWLAVTGRFKALMLKAPGATADITKQAITLTWPENTPANLQLSIAPKTNLTDINPEWGDLRYQHLWGWLATISKGIEWSLVFIQKHIASNWGWAIIVFAVLLKILLLPLSLFTARLQHQASHYQSILIPQLSEIKKNYDGEEAHERIMAAHKKLGITPFYTLKPMIGILILLPILVAIFNTLGEMPQLANASFLWIKNLAYPDAIFTLPFTIPYLGNTFNLLPFVMSIVIIFSTPLFQHNHTPPLQAKRQKRNLFLMAIAFFVLFYPFPAAMVLYWTLANFLQAVQQKLVK